LNELQNIGLATHIFNLLLSNLGLRFDCTEENIKSDSSSIQCGFLGHQGQLFAIFLNVKVANPFAVKLKTKSISVPVPPKIEDDEINLRRFHRQGGRRIVQSIEF